VEKIDISVGLCTYNRLKMLRNTLDSLLRQQTDGTLTYEIVIVDDGSTDETPIFVRELANCSSIPIRYFREERVGVASARNRVVRESCGEWIAFIDDDETAEPDWLQQLIFAAQASNADCVGGSLKLALSEDAGSFASTTRKNLGETSRQGWFQKRFNYPGPGTGNALVRRELFEKVGLFDPSLNVVGEDQDFFRRARQAGFKTVFNSEALVHHFMPAHRLQPPYLLATASQYGKSLAFFDCREWGYAKATLVCGMRLGHVTAKSLLVAFKYLYKQDRSSLLGLKCSLYTTIAYTKELIARLLSNAFT
jgi:glycosyltransferase involved in cell wall biosynthesis